MKKKIILLFVFMAIVVNLSSCYVHVHDRDDYHGEHHWRHHHEGHGEHEEHEGHEHHW